MFWNHDTPTQEIERPVGDLDRLAGILTVDAFYDENGTSGPGAYAEAKVFAGYAETIDEIGGEIGLSLRAGGFYEPDVGVREGKTGRIVSEMVPDPRVGVRVDFVTESGAGGEIVKLFEAAPGSPTLPEPTLDPQIVEYLAEAGRVLSKKNEEMLRTALAQLTAVLSVLAIEESAGALKEAANAAEWVQARLHQGFTNMADVMFGEGRLNLEERKTLSFAIGQALEAYRAAVTAQAPQLYKRGPWEQAPASADIIESGIASDEENDEMSEKELLAAQQALAAQATQLTEARAALAKSDSVTIVTTALDGKGLTPLVEARLRQSLSESVPVDENGALKEADMKQLAETAVVAALAESAELSGAGQNQGDIEGMGESAYPAGSDSANGTTLIAESTKRINDALASVGYGGQNG